MESFGVFVVFGVNLGHFRLENFNELVSVLNILIDEVYRKFDKNCIKMFKLWKFLIFVVFGTFFQKKRIYLFINNYWTTTSSLAEPFRHFNPRDPSKN